MTKVAAGITISLDGYVAGPDDGPGRGLGEGGERLHYWVFGGPWTYEEEPRGEATGADKEFLDDGDLARGASSAAQHLRGGAGVGRPEPVRPAVLHRHAPARGRARTPAYVRERAGRGDRAGARGRGRQGRVRHGRGRT